MTTAVGTLEGTRSKREIALMALLAGQFFGIGGLLQYYAWVKENSVSLRFYAVGLLICAVVTMYAVWTRKEWAPWMVLVTVSLKLVVDLLNWTLELDRMLIPLSEVVNGSIIVLAFVTYDYPTTDRVTRGMKIFFGFVFALAAFVGYYGFFRSAKVDVALPRLIPPMDSQFLGAMYLSGATFMTFGMLAKRWREVQVMVPMISIWTGMLGFVSLLHPELFDFGGVQTWVWFMAYFSYPLIAAWIAYQQRSRYEQPLDEPMSPLLRGYFYVQGTVITLLAIALLFAPEIMAASWPWGTPPALARIYCAPFFSYGIGSLFAARQKNWTEVRIPVQSILVFTVFVLIASFIHRDVFDLGSAAGIAWFGAFGVATVALAAFAAVPSLRVRRQAVSTSS